MVASPAPRLLGRLAWRHARPFTDAIVTNHHRKSLSQPLRHSLSQSLTRSLACSLHRSRPIQPPHAMADRQGRVTALERGVAAWVPSRRTDRPTDGAESRVEFELKLEFRTFCHAFQLEPAKSHARENPCYAFGHVHWIAIRYEYPPPVVGPATRHEHERDVVVRRNCGGRNVSAVSHV